MNRTVEYILAVAEYGGITKAANMLCITPSALSKFIIQKEKELGVKLFHRDGNQFVLTYAGERYVELLNELKKTESRMELEMSRLADMYSGRLRIGFQQFLAETITGPILLSLKNKHPGVHITLDEAGYRVLLDRLQRRQADAALLLAVNPGLSGYRFKEILQTPIVLAFPRGCVPEEPAERKAGFSFPWLPDDYIRKQRLILDEGAASFLRYAPHLLEGGDPYSRSSVTVRSAKTALHCVANGLGIIVIPRLQVTELHFEDSVACYSFGSKETSVSLGVLSDEKSMLAEEIRYLEEIIEDHFISRNQPKS